MHVRVMGDALAANPRVPVHVWGEDALAADPRVNACMFVSWGMRSPLTPVFVCMCGGRMRSPLTPVC